MRRADALTGYTAPPAEGQNFRRADVNVTFDGGTGIYKNARGEAKVVAKLYQDGLSVGHIQGTVNVP